MDEDVYKRQDAAHLAVVCLDLDPDHQRHQAAEHEEAAGRGNEHSLSLIHICVSQRLTALPAASAALRVKILFAIIGTFITRPVKE